MYIRILNRCQYTNLMNKWINKFYAQRSVNCVFNFQLLHYIGILNPCPFGLLFCRVFVEKYAVII